MTMRAYIEGHGRLSNKFRGRGVPPETLLSKLGAAVYAWTCNDEFGRAEPANCRRCTTGSFVTHAISAIIFQVQADTMLLQCVEVLRL